MPVRAGKKLGMPDLWQALNHCDANPVLNIRARLGLI